MDDNELFLLKKKKKIGKLRIIRAILLIKKKILYNIIHNLLFNK